MLGNLGKSPSKRGRISKIYRFSGCKTAPSLVPLERWYETPERGIVPRNAASGSSASELRPVFLLGLSFLVLSGCALSPTTAEKQETSLDRIEIAPDDVELTPAQQAALLSLSKESRTPLRIQFDPATGIPVWIGLQLPVGFSDPRTNVQAFLSEFGDLFQLDEIGSLRDSSDVVETPCCHKIRLSQYAHGIPVYAAGMEFVQHKNGWLSNVKALLTPDVPLPGGAISAEQAKGTLYNLFSHRLSGEAFNSMKVEKSILTTHLSQEQPGRSYTSWRFNFRPPDAKHTTDWFIDASSGAFLAEFLSVPLHAEYAEASEAAADWPLSTHNTDYTSGSFYSPLWSDTGSSATLDSCSDTKLEEVKANATENGAKTVSINCDLILQGNETITKRLVLEGSEATGVTVDCNGATLNGGEGTPNYRKDMIEIRSRSYVKDGERQWERIRDVVIRECKVIGSVRIWGMARNGEGTEYEEDGNVNHYKISSRNSGHTARARANAPTNIVLERMVVTGVGRNPLYFAPGVTFSKLVESTMDGKSDHVAIYLDAESAWNTIRNNQIHVETGDMFWTPPRPLIAVDGSSRNTIIGNRLSALNHGGIYLYRNCGEGGVIRHATPSYNTVINNIFFYRKYTGASPAVYLGSRDGGGWFGSSNTFFGYCDDDEGYLDVGSSKSDEDNARNNVVMQNQFYERRIRRPGLFGSALAAATLDDMINSKDWENNSPNVIDYNELVSDETVVKHRLAGCYKSDVYRNHFLLHQDTVELFEDAMGRPYTVLFAYTCNDGVGSYVLSTSDRQVVRPGFECQVNGDNSGCVETTSCPSGKEIIGATAACNLEFGAVSEAALSLVPGNIVRVLRASDDVSSGSCRLGAESIRSGEEEIARFDNSGETSVGCKEHDKNGGDCHIKGLLYCY